MAGVEGLEPSARGFGDHCSTNWAIPLQTNIIIAQISNKSKDFYWIYRTAKGMLKWNAIVYLLELFKFYFDNGFIWYTIK